MINLEKTNNFHGKINKLKNEYREQGNILMKELIKEFLQTYNFIYGICFAGYTPYFNDDGDECTYGVLGIEFLTKKSVEIPDYAKDSINEKCYYARKIIDSGDSDWDGKSIYTYKLPAEVKKDFNAVEKFIYANKDLIKSLFDDHKIILISEKEVKTIDYDHD